MIYNKSCVEGMKEIEAETVDLIIADPPYNIGKDFNNQSDKQRMTDYLTWCDEWISECIRILKPTGILYIYGFSEILAYIRVRIDIPVRWLVWCYKNRMGSPKLNHYQRSHESILCCSKSTHPHFTRDEIRIPYSDTYKKTHGKIRKTNDKSRFGGVETTYDVNPLGALPRDVIECPVLAGGAGKKERVNHPTQKPLHLCRTLIKSVLSENMKIVIPFVGSGSECVAAKELGLEYIGFEINPDYIELANSRLE